MNTSIDPHALVNSKAKLATGVTVGPFTVIEDDVEIGEGSWIGSHVAIHSGARIGRKCQIHSGAAIAGAPQDLKFQGEKTLLEIGDETVVREYATLNRGTAESGVTKIGRNCLFMAYTHVAHDCQLGDHVILANCVALGGHVVLGNWVIIGGLTPVHQFVHVGEHSMIGGGFRVPKDVPPYILAGEDPLMFERLNLVGLRRRGVNEKSIVSLDHAYRILYKSNLNVSQAVAKIKDEVEKTAEVERVISFIEASKRGIIPGPGRRKER